MKSKLLFFVFLPILIAAGPCQPKDDALTAQEAKLALDEVALSAQADSLISGTVEISTNFTIGQAVEAAAEELRTFIESQLPCAEITLESTKLTVAYGVFEGNCTYNGHTYSGTHSVTIASADAGALVVEHVWTELSNGVVSVSGDATVTWSAADVSRNVTHSLTWRRIADDKTMNGSGDRIQTVLAGGLAEGIQVDGMRNWSGDSGEWDLDIDAVQIRWIDPVPQSGKYALVTPDEKVLSMSFERQDEDTITVTVANGENSIDLNISKSGEVSEK